MITVHTSTQLLELIDRHDQVAVNALLALYERQTRDEQEAGATSHQNGIGFSGCDAEILSSFAQQVQENREKRARGERPAHWSDLSPKQMALLRKRLHRYGRQLTEIAAEKTARRAA